MKSKKDESLQKWCISVGYFRPHVVNLTKEGMNQLPESMKRHVGSGGKLWLIKEPKDGKALISISKTNEKAGVYVDASKVIGKIRIHPEYIPYMSEADRKHIENGGNLYMIGEPMNGKILVSDSLELDGNVVMEDYYKFPENAETGHSEMAAIMVECISTIKMCKNDMDKAYNACITLYNYLVYCTTLKELDDLTSIYRDKAEDNIVGYNPTAVSKFVEKMRTRYPKEKYIE